MRVNRMKHIVRKRRKLVCLFISPYRLYCTRIRSKKLNKVSEARKKEGETNEKGIAYNISYPKRNQLTTSRYIYSSITTLAI